MKSFARILYAGTPEFALPPLQHLHKAGFEVCAVYTQPDRKAGRGRKLTASPVKRWALEHGLPVEQPLTLRELPAQERLAAYEVDLMVVTAYGLILPGAVLAMPRLGCVNLHASLLPRWRGAAPIQRAIQAGDRETGVTLMQMDAGLDTGAMLAKKTIAVLPGETSAELHEKLASVGAELLLEKLPELLGGCLQGEPQQEQLASYAYKIKKEEASLDWHKSAEQLACQIAAFNPWPMSQTRWYDKVLRIGRAIALKKEVAEKRKAGEVIAASNQGIDIVCAKGVLRILELQLPGARMISSADFCHAHQITGDTLS